MKTHIYLLLVVPILLVVLHSCKKDPVKISAKHSSLIVGKWLAYERHSKVYSTFDNSLVKDTIIHYGNKQNTSWWYEIYDANGTAFVTGKPYTIAGTEKADTTSFLRYSIEGSHLTLKPNGGGTETKPILGLSENDMSLESTYNMLARIGWGLAADSTYTYVDEVLYKKQ